MSNQTWPLVPLGDVVTHRKEFIQIDDFSIYKRCRVQLHAQGVVLRDEVEGSLIKTKTQQVCRADDFLVAEIDAKMGGFGLVPRELDGAIVSSHYFLFTPKPEKLVTAFLGYYCQTPAFRDQVTSRGTTNYAAIRPSHVLGYTIPLPPLKEQQRIVDRIDSLISKVAEAKQTSRKVGTQSRLLAVSLAHRADLSKQEKQAMVWREVMLGDVMREDFDDHKVVASQEYPNFGLYSYGRGLFAKAPISGMATSATRLRRVRAGQFIYSRLFAWEGAFGLVTPEFNGWFVSGEYPTFACNLSEVLPEFLLAYVQAKQAWDAVAVGSKGLESRRQRVQPEQILAHRLMLTPMHVQMQLRKLNSFVPEIEETRNKLCIEIDAMLPSILDSALKGTL